MAEPVPDADGHLSPDDLASLALDGPRAPCPPGTALHLSRCAGCRGLLAELRRAVAAGRETSDLDALRPPPARLWDAIHHEIHRRPGPQPPPPDAGAGPVPRPPDTPITPVAPITSVPPHEAPPSWPASPSRRRPGPASALATAAATATAAVAVAVLRTALRRRARNASARA
ncbi:hypothetical protein GCM10010358_32750 [Streptomyces minutiscleroticus]|uniref:Zinc-finger domain-containing protein n=1 Tax=Streptomyces minutiscleroticus TaxID=68238 RepID=A0A918NKN0_9ACTN|nr:hypothetical protein [Streptomyces minutiscleroticus]GGX75850.1 hypothetical protein GCM10010358_32750 [Streptomyces minutiscleroticus]